MSTKCDYTLYYNVIVVTVHLLYSNTLPDASEESYYTGGRLMPNNELFIVRPKSADKKEDKSITMTIRLERELQEEYDKLSAKSGRSRNELMCMALRYALNNLKFVE